MAAGEHASAPQQLRWIRRVLAHPLAHAVVYSSCGAMWMINAGVALGILGRRAGGAVGARMDEAGKSAACMAILPFLFSPVAWFLLGLRAAVAARESDEAPAPKPPRDRREIWWAVFRHLVKDFKLASYLLFLLAMVGLFLQMSTLGKGCFAEKLGSVVFDLSIISISVIQCCFVCPRWILEWRTGKQSC